VLSLASFCWTLTKYSWPCCVAGVSGWSGTFCEYSSYADEYSPALLHPGTSINTQLMHVDAGKAVTWVVWFETPTENPHLTFKWESKGGSNLGALGVDAYHLAPGDYYEGNTEVKELCWTAVGSCIPWGITCIMVC
jgi:hypothetical protein